MTETESRPRNRALVASFLFTDLVGYSKGTASEQYAEKAALSEILRGTLAPLAADDYRIKDTGDGALIAFLSNPEHALYAALAITSDFARAAASAGFPSSTLRTGLHVGAVKEAIDLEARPNFVGDGINAAKRIMDFAAPGQITASRSYFEAVSWLDSAYGAMFEHLGSSDDKHGRAHDLYAILPDAAVLQKLRSELAPTSRTGDARETGGEATIVAGGETRPAPAVGTPAPTRRATARNRVLPIAALVAFGAAVAFFMVPRAPAPIAVTAQPSVQDSGARPLGAASGEGTSTPPVETPATASAPPVEAKPMPQPDTKSTPSAPLPSAPEITSPATAPRNPEKMPAPPVPRSAAVPPATEAGRSADARRKSTETQGAAIPTASAAGQGSERCRRIVEKAALGEPLSQEENRELASTCR